MVRGYAVGQGVPALTEWALFGFEQLVACQNGSRLIRSSASGMNAYQQVLKLAFELHNAGRHGDAEAVCRVLLVQDAGDGQLQFLLGMVLQRLGRSQEALGYLERAAELQPRSARVLNGLGFIHLSLRNYERAVENYGRAIELGQQTPDTFYSMGNACHQLGEVERAIPLFQKAVELNPKDGASWNNLGKCLKDANRLEESIVAYNHAVAVAPDYALAHYGRAVTLLAAGRLPEGFPEYEKWSRHRKPATEFSQPVWQGEPIPGRTLFLYAEQGIGDAIQAARFLPAVRARAGRVILECRPELKRLLAHSGCADVVLAHGESIPEFDCYASAVSLAAILGVTVDTIPGCTPYLKTPAAPALPPSPAGHLKVGLAWAGNPDHHNDAARSLPLEALAPLFQVPGVTFYNLQKTVRDRDQAYLRSLPALVNAGAGFKDIFDAAAGVAGLDLVIAVDTAMAHLAGALAKPVWLLLPFSPDWRWFLDRTDTPWYPTMRLFRQAQRGQWGPVVRQAAEELGRLAAAHNYK